MRPAEATFVFKEYKSDFSRGKVDFCYEIKSGGRTAIEFIETLKFKKPFEGSNNVPLELLAKALDNLFLILGISYWKTYCPHKIEILPFTLSKKEAEFWDMVYTKGLGEFFYKNNINFRGIIKFPYSAGAKNYPIHFKAGKRALLLFGGGKDSLVAAEMLKKKKKDFVLFRVGESAIQKKTASLAGKSSIIFERALDPKLIVLNKKKGVYNGHIPASAIYAFAGVFAGILHGYGKVIASNEKSANYGNVEYKGVMVNHQWSKSQEFEALLGAYLREFLTPDIHYHSILRSFTELEIVKKFVNYPFYFKYFSSCNRNFSITKKAERKWCGECPKCAFVFVALAAYLSKEEVRKIFGKNLFADKNLISLYKELLGLEKFKPFECVGTPMETKKAFELIWKKGEYNQAPVIRYLQGIALQSNHAFTRSKK